MYHHEQRQSENNKTLSWKALVLILRRNCNVSVKNKIFKWNGTQILTINRIPKLKTENLTLSNSFIETLLQKVTALMVTNVIFPITLNIYIIMNKMITWILGVW